MPLHADDRRAAADAALLGRFAAQYEGRHDPADALHWLSDPASPGPSGAPSPLLMLEKARSALYRSDADDPTRRRFHELADRVEVDRQAAVTALARANGTEARPPWPATTSWRRAWRRRRGRLAIVGLGAISVAVVAALGLGALLAPRTVVVTMTPLRMVSTTSDPSSKEAAMLSLFAGSFAAENQLALRTVIDRPPALAHGGVQRVSVERLTGSAVIAAPGPARATSGSVTVLVLCTTASAYRWTLTGRDASEPGRMRVLATSSATGCRGIAAYATVFLHEQTVTALRLITRPGDRTLTAVVVTPSRQ